MSQHSGFWIIAIVVGLLTGALLGAQPSANGFLGRQVEHPLQASVISFTTGTLLLLTITLILGEFPPKFKVAPSTLPWWAWIGGAIGTVMVSTSLYFVPRIGSLYWFALVMTGQIVASLVLDHYGLMGNPKHPPSYGRLFGALLLVVGVLCIAYSPKSSVVQQSHRGTGDSENSVADPEDRDAVRQLAEHLGEES